MTGLAAKPRCGGEDLVMVARARPARSCRRKPGLRNQRLRRARRAGPRMVARHRKIERFQRLQLAMSRANDSVGRRCCDCAGERAADRLRRAIAVSSSPRRHRRSPPDTAARRDAARLSRPSHGRRAAAAAAAGRFANRRSEPRRAHSSVRRKRRSRRRTTPSRLRRSSARCASSPTIRCCGSSSARCVWPKATTCRRRTWARKAVSMSVNAPRAQSVGVALIADSYRARGKNIEAQEAQARSESLSG